jgi:hypothetical protein
MLDKRMDDYVTRVEEEAYESGLLVGKHQERKRIITMLEKKLEEYNSQGLWELGDGISDAITYISMGK